MTRKGLFLRTKLTSSGSNVLPRHRQMFCRVLLVSWKKKMPKRG